MISDETFPSDYLSDFEEDHQTNLKKKVKAATTIALNGIKPICNTSLQSSPATEEEDEDELNSSTEIEQSIIINSMETDQLIQSSSDFQNTEDINLTQTSSFECKTTISQSDNILPSSRGAPIKKKKSFSCQNLHKRTSYDHVESKVKKLIENLAEDRRKTLLRHKSMPVCVTQTPAIDDEPPTPEMDKDLNDLKRELRRKSIKIYELEEMCEMKDNQIYELEREKCRLKMIFDKLRVDIQQLKEVERQYKHLKSQYSPNRTLRNALIQTDNDSGIDNRGDSINYLRESVVITQQHSEINRHLLNPAIRQLAFEHSNMNQSHFSEINNTSSDNLIPAEAEIHLDNIDLNDTDVENKKETDGDGEEDNKTQKRSKKRRFFKFVPCISFK